jgi:hypothetical protein
MNGSYDSKMSISSEADPKAQANPLPHHAWRREAVRCERLLITGADSDRTRSNLVLLLFQAASDQQQLRNPRCVSRVASCLCRAVVA